MALTEPIQVVTGLVAGIASEHKPGVTIFRGIPFAASTAGENRWRAPQPAPSWTGVRDCSKFGDMAPQLPPGPLYWTAEPPAQSEDCLNLNIWTPAGPSDIGSARYPVYVWIYGGKFLWGAGSDNNFDGTSLAAKGVIVVTFNYRLGILGWLAHPELSAECPGGHNASGNYGLQDQIACLQWIQQNITSFGGDPNRVTIGEQAEREGKEIFTEKGAKTVADMRAMSLEKLLEGNHRDDTTMWGPPPFYRACLDGWLFPRTYEETLLQGTMNDVPLLNGQNRDESGNYTHPDFNEQDLAEAAAAKYGSFAGRFFELYGGEGTALQQWNAACQDNSRVGPHLHFDLWKKHAKSPIYIYHWIHAPPQRRGFRTDYPVPKAKGYVFFNGSRTGAYHAAEIPYVFDSLWTAPVDPFTDTDRQVADMASDIWASFIKTGKPDAGSQYLHWPSAGEDPEHVMEIGETLRLIPNAKNHDREQFWADYFEAQKIW
ncbi:hypothetical protein SCUCBS95973_009878 [Sporothrix curviconia]|uniref:Carboxylesterase type B domain-containing protein n=1 Tax=Sporothrix curviconia TaxID=1260050 RepID=A0ABP0CYI3_9PEZI